MQAQFAKFVELLGGCPDEQKVRLLALFDSLIGNQQDFIQFLIDECDYVEDDFVEIFEFGDTYDVRYGICQLLYYFLDGYYDDWRMSYDYLAKYITLCIGQEFIISDYDYYKVCQTLENQSDFTLFRIIDRNETAGVWVVKKSDKPKLIELADELGLIAG